MLEMFGYQKGGANVVRLGLKDLAHAAAQDAYVAECGKLVDDLNARYGGAVAARGGAADEYELLRLPDRRFLRRRGDPAFEMAGVSGEGFSDVDAYVAHLGAHLPEAYLASRDLRHYVETLRQVLAGELSVADAVRRTPQLARVGGACPCAKAVRCVAEEAEEVPPTAP